MNNWRLTFVFLILLLLGTAIIGRLVFLQVVNHGFYKALAQGQQNVSSLVKGERGQIFTQDREGELHLMATNYRFPFVFLSPPEIEEMEEVTTQLASILDISEEFIRERTLRSESLFEVLKKDLSPQEKEAIETLELKGVYIGKETRRLYPQENIAAQLIGFSNLEGKGQYGVEEMYNIYLEGKEGIEKSANNPGGYLFLSNDLSKDGADIVLTVDHNIQAKAEELLSSTAKRLNASGGSITVIDPTTGKILALANYPSFDPNEYGKVKDLGIFQNDAVNKIYEPGSVFKPITMASAIDTGSITPDTTYFDEGTVEVGGHTITNYEEKSYGEQTMNQVLAFSINTGAVFAEQQLGHENFTRYLDKFGFFEPTNVDLVGEIYSENREFKKGWEINYATASFGQGIEITPLQLLRAYSAIANNGVMTTPYIVEKILDKRGETWEQPERIKKAVLSPRTATQVNTMLVNVIENTFYRSVKIPGYYIGGKTGTSQVSWSALGIPKGGYSDQTIQSFIGYAPAFNPKFLALIKLNNPATESARQSAVPIFKDLAKYIIDYYQIVPDYEIED